MQIVISTPAWDSGDLHTKLSHHSLYTRRNLTSIFLYTFLPSFLRYTLRATQPESRFFWSLYREEAEPETGTDILVSRRTAALDAPPLLPLFWAATHSRGCCKAYKSAAIINTISISKWLRHMRLEKGFFLYLAPADDLPVIQTIFTTIIFNIIRDPLLRNIPVSQMFRFDGSYEINLSDISSFHPCARTSARTQTEETMVLQKYAAHLSVSPVLKCTCVRSRSYRYLLLHFFTMKQTEFLTSAKKTQRTCTYTRAIHILIGTQCM